MDDASAIMTDERIGGLVDERYKVLEAMAAGSMGAVYKAERVPVGKLVAIKFLHAPFANDAEFLARFERETRVMSKLAHPNCVSVVDFGVWEGAPYLVMEYVSGTTLRALIDNGPLPIKRALALIRQIAAGLAHAHAQGVVHRDVKPANIMITEEIGTGDHVRILDFGLARLRGAVGRDATQSNVVVGTPNYMAPEQTVGGGLIDARTDIYAVGIVLFEMICGERPFQAEDTLALLGMHRAAPIPKLADRVASNVRLPRGLQEVVEKAMAKSPSDRYQSAIELAEAIDDIGARAATRDGRDGVAGDLIVRRSAGTKQVTGTAPTMLDISDAAELVPPPPPPRRAQPRPSGFLGSLIFLAILLGGVAAAVVWVKDRSAGTKVATRVDTAPTLMPPPTPELSPDPRGVPIPPPAPELKPDPKVDSPPAGSGANAATDIADAAQGSAGSGSAAAAGSESRGSDVTPPSAGSGEGGPPIAAPPPATDVAAGSAEIEMDPATAEDPAPASTKPAPDADEAANAPKTAEEAERHTLPTPVRATTLAGAVQLVQEGKRDLALASLHQLWKKTPNSAYIPFLLGNLYYDQNWWSVAMDHYDAAIKKNAQYRSNPTINRNVIRMLASNKTARKAQTFLKYRVGKLALPYVKYAAQHDANSQVKRLSGWLAKNI
jgi:serine/threonine-protein kinase